MTPFVAGALGSGYGAALALLGILTLAGGGHGLVFLPPSLLASPLVVLGPFGYVILPFLWGAIAVMASSTIAVRRQRARIFILVHYAGLPFAILVTRAFAVEDVALLEQHGRAVAAAAVPIALVYVAGQVWLWWLSRDGQRTPLRQEAV